MTETKERPILFSGPMVRALLEGRKTQTRRIVKPQPELVPVESLHGRPEGSYWWASNVAQSMVDLTEMRALSPYGMRGDRLWVRETWAVGKCADGFAPAELDPRTWRVDNGGLWYDADATEPKHPISPIGRRRASIHMPRWASRLTLELTGVRVERLQDISDADAIAEGVERSHYDYSAVAGSLVSGSIHCDRYARLWDSINALKITKRTGRAKTGTRHYPWSANPWVWVLEFPPAAA